MVVEVAVGKVVVEVAVGMAAAVVVGKGRERKTRRQKWMKG